MNLTLKNLSAQARELFERTIEEAKKLGHEFEALFEHDGEPTPAAKPVPSPNDGGGPGSGSGGGPHQN